MATFIGSISALTFDHTLEDWPTYVEWAEQFMKANTVKDDNRVPPLLALMGSSTYSLLRNPVSPKKPPEMNYSDIVTTLTKHLAPKPLVIAERFRFHKRNQATGEPSLRTLLPSGSWLGIIISENSSMTPSEINLSVV